MLQLNPAKMNVKPRPVDEGAIFIDFKLLYLGSIRIPEIRKFLDWNIQTVEVRGDHM